MGAMQDGVLPVLAWTYPHERCVASIAVKPVPGDENMQALTQLTLSLCCEVSVGCEQDVVVGRRALLCARHSLYLNALCDHLEEPHLTFQYTV